MEQAIKEVIVVEGKTDSEKLKQLFIVDTIETNGLALNDKLINLINKVNNERGVILFLDPDGPGEKIRKKCSEKLENCKHAFIDKNKCKYKTKVGVAQTPNELIIDAIEKVVTFNKSNDSLSWQEYLQMNLNSKSKRKVVTDYLNISECNNKQLFKRLNMMNVDLKELEKIANGNI